MAVRSTGEPAIDFSTFPATDGKPVADTEVNLEQMIELILELRQAEAPYDHHVGGNLLIYYNPKNGWDHCSPDVFVALDAGSALRESWKVWLEGKFPEVVVEIASPSTQQHDITSKVALYERLGAHEYYIYDPTGRLQPAFRGYARQHGRLVPLPNPTGLSMISRVLGLEFRVDGQWLRVIDPLTGRPYPSPAEEQRLRVIAELHAAEETRLRQEAEEARKEAEEAWHAAETRAVAEAQARRAAENAHRASEDARQLAEARATQEARARQDLEAALQAALAELARLQRQEPA
jgi:Uma2 family endonuclease